MKRLLWLAIAGVTSSGCATATAPPLVGDGTPVLFIGNSYLYSQDIPGIVQALADSAGGERLAVMVIAGPNAALIDHWNEGTAQRAIRDNDFKWVVLQQGPSSVEINRDSLRLVTRFFADVITNAGDGTAALFSAWPSESRSQDFPRAIESYRLAAADVNGLLLPVAASWLEAWQRDSTLQLYADGLHPSNAGAYVSALVVYAGLLGKSPIGLPSSLRTRDGVSINVPPAVARTLQDAAAAAAGVR